VVRALRGRGRRPLVLVDVAVPRDIEPAAGQLEGVFVHSIDALRTIVDRNLARRRHEAPKVERIVDGEVDRFARWVGSLEATPTVVELRARFEKIRQEELERHLRHFDPAERERLEAMTRGLINKLLHLPTTRLRSLDLHSEEGQACLTAVREAFGL
jgi:glutamyl-tRNA reductase